jgi:2-polyprenyl-6-methoxyphenol hydroxylase-like FAD-dependent oxidoreductase
MRIVVVGAGVGGLTCAIALRDAGFDVEVVERAANLAEVGAGISLWPNALAALAEVGLEEPVRTVGQELATGNVRNRSGQMVNVWSREQTRSYLGGTPVMMHRADLQRVLLDAAEGIPISLDTPCRDVSQDAGSVTVLLGDGTKRPADLVVGADGLRSAVRAAVAPGRPRFVGLAAWRAVISGVEPPTESWLSVGEGKQFLAAPLSHERTYVSGLLSMDEGAMNKEVMVGPFLAQLFRGWHEPIERLIAATPEDAYIRTDIYDRPRPARLCWGRVALIGDAAHPVTPDLGQGGCLAIEDAVVLSRCLQRTNGVPLALKDFEERRLSRIRMISFESHWTGRFFAANSPLTSALRTAALSAVPGRIRLGHLARYASRDAFLRTLPTGTNPTTARQPED